MPQLINKNLNDSIENPTSEMGFVTSARDYLLYIEGLPSAKIDDLIETSQGYRALVTGLDREKVEALMLDPDRPIPGDSFTIKFAGLQLPKASKLLGRVINPLGEPLDGKPGFPQLDSKIDLGITAAGIEARKIISKQLYTGITVVDTLLPIGRGQRELIIGEPRSGKSGFLLDVILNQKDKNTICIYAALGRSETDVTRLIRNIAAGGASPFTTILAATSNQSAPLISIAPTVACSLAEQYLISGWDVLLILDDLGTHAKYLREIALLSGRIPGRESYPADIFHAHSHLTERAGNFNEKHGNASITLLPVIETDLENFTNLIPTNIMSMTDGHLLFSAALRAQGQYPAVVPDRSVTRVGHQTQKPIHKVVADQIRSLLADYHELERYGRFGSELTSQTQLLIKRGLMTNELLRQEPGEKIDPIVQILWLSLIFTRFFDDKTIETIRKFKSKILELIKTSPEFVKIGNSLDSIDFDNLIEKLKNNVKTLEAICQ